jgi:hypothetical protein
MHAEAEADGEIAPLLAESPDHVSLHVPASPDPYPPAIGPRRPAAVAYIFEPPEATLGAVLPPRRLLLPEDIPAPEGKLRFIRPRPGEKLGAQNGVLCPACHRTNTSYKGCYARSVKMSDLRRRPKPNTHEAKQDVFTCHSAEVANHKVEERCSMCVVCRGDAILMTFCEHECPNRNFELLFISPNTKCSGCDYFNKSLCHCQICHSAPHAKEFRIENDPASESDPYPVYPAVQGVISKHDQKLRLKYEKARVAMMQEHTEATRFSNIRDHLASLLQGESDGYIVLAEILVIVIIIIINNT